MTRLLTTLVTDGSRALGSGLQRGRHREFINRWLIARMRLSEGRLGCSPGTRQGETGGHYFAFFFEWLFEVIHHLVEFCICWRGIHLFWTIPLVEGIAPKIGWKTLICTILDMVGVLVRKDHFSVKILLCQASLLLWSQ